MTGLKKPSTQYFSIETEESSVCIVVPHSVTVGDLVEIVGQDNPLGASFTIVVTPMRHRDKKWYDGLEDLLP